MALTKRQKDFLNFLSDFLEKRGYSPSYEEIAEVLGCSLSATKSLIHRARETLKARLKPYLHSGAWDEKK